MARPVKEVFADALELPAAERAAFLDRECAGDPEARAKLEHLLRVHAGGERFLSQPDAAPLHEVPGMRIGPYRLLEKLGEGGFGAVFLAEQTEPLVRRVALKVIKLGMDTRQVIARFEAERQALAMMDHPNIAKVLDAGATASGRPFFVMELVRGRPITEFCDEHHLDTSARLELFQQVCHAVQHAHQKGIIHRDLKPGNVLVAMQDGAPVPKVIDFGVAKATLARLTERTLYTENRQLIGTPAYMSPEQARMDSADIDTRSDVYSLGVLLYEILTGTTPIEGRRLRAAAWDEMLRMIREVETPRPSTRITSVADAASVAEHRATEPSRLARMLRGDLDWIAMKALEKDRARRYPSPNDLAADLARHLAGEPVVAAPPSALYRVGKFVRRHRLGVTASVVVVLALATATVGTLVGLVRESRQRAKAEEIAAFMQETFEGVRPAVARGRDTTMLLEMVDAAAARILRSELAAVPEAELSLRLTIAKAYRELASFDSAEGMIVPALALADRFAGDEDTPERTTAWQELGRLRCKQGRSQEGLALLEKACAARRRIGGDDPELSAILVDVAFALSDLGRGPEAEPLTLEALEMARRLGEPKRIASMLRARAQVLTTLDHLPESEASLREAMAIWDRIEPGDHPEKTSCMNELSILLQFHGRLEEAEQLLIRTIEARRRIYGGPHPKIAVALNNLAGLCQSQGRLAESVELFEETLAMLRSIPGAPQADIEWTLQGLALSLFRLGRLDEAEAKLREVVQVCATASPSDRARAAHARHGLARILQDRQRFTEAESVLLAAWDLSPDEKSQPGLDTARAIVELHEDWEQADPGGGHEGQAALWRVRLPLEERSPR